MAPAGDISGMLDALAPVLYGGVLVMARLSALTWWLPGLTLGRIPGRVRALAVLTFAVVIDLGLGGVVVDIPSSPILMGLQVGREVLLGATMGFALRVVLAAVEVAGSLAGISMGLSLNLFVDPVSGDQSLQLGSLLGMFAGLMFLAIGGHRVMLLAFFEHFQAFPAGAAAYYVPDAAAVARQLGDLSTTALQLAAPVIVVTLVLNIALAFVTRAVPSVNLFGIGLGMLILAGFLAMGSQGDAILMHMERSVEQLPDRMVEHSGTGRVR